MTTEAVYPHDSSLSREERQAAWEASWRESRRDGERMMGVPEGHLYDPDEPYVAEEDLGRPEWWDNAWRELEAQRGREWMDQYGINSMEVGLEFCGVQLPGWEPPPPLTPEERARYAVSRQTE